MRKLKRKLFFPYSNYSERLSQDMTVFQTPELLREYYKNAFIYGLRNRMIPITLSVIDEKKMKMIFPAFSSGGGQKLCIAGIANGMSYLNLCYFESSELELREDFTYLLNQSKAQNIVLERIPENSKTAEILLEGIPGYQTVTSELENVKIYFRSGYDTWKAELSKSTRQNLRTAYNRIKSDQGIYQLQTYRGGEITQATMSALVDVYNQRHKEHYGIKTSRLKNFYLRYLDFSTRALKKNPNAVSYVLYINGKIAAFLSGYYDDFQKSLIVPRLSINEEFSRYSPGYILLNETIQCLCEEARVNSVDLSMGTERYKLALGGTVYRTFKFVMKRNI